MANFPTHITTAGICSGALAIASLYAGLANTQQALLLWSLGALGGLLPDIDSDNSSSLRIIHGLLTIILAGCLASYLVPRVSMGMNMVLVAFAIISQHCVALPLIRRLTVHRGNCHSLLAGVTAALITTNICIYSLGTTLQLAFLAGLFLAAGFLVHLLLDEGCAIDFGRARLKKSFGSAIKPIQTGTPVTTGLLTICCASQVFLLPDFRPLKLVVLQLVATSREMLG